MKGKTWRILDANVEIIFITLKEFLRQNTKIANHKGLENLTTLWTLSFSNIILLKIFFGESNVI